MRLYFQLVASGDASKTWVRATDRGKPRLRPCGCWPRCGRKIRLPRRIGQAGRCGSRRARGGWFSLSTSTAVFTERCGGSGSIARMPVCQRGHRRP
jgi:hypothetical protein